MPTSGVSAGLLLSYLCAYVSQACLSCRSLLQCAASIPSAVGAMGAQEHLLSYSCADAGMAYYQHDDREKTVQAVMGLHKVSCASITTLRAALGATSLSSQQCAHL